MSTGPRRYPRRRLWDPLLRLLARPRPTGQPPTEQPPAPEPPDTATVTGVDQGDQDASVVRPFLLAWPVPAGGDGDGAWDDDADTERSCALDGAPYFGTGVRGRYCSWACAAAASPDSEDEDRPGQPTGWPVDSWGAPGTPGPGPDPWSTLPRSSTS